MTPEPQHATERCASSRVRRALGAVRVRDFAKSWNATAEERTASYPCDRYVTAPYETFLRAVDVAASSGLGRARRILLAYGDLIMARKQLLTLKRCAERTAERHASK